MGRISRRRWLQQSGAATFASSLAGGFTTSALGRSRLPGRRIATFRTDVTPPLGHPLLGGNYRGAESIGDPLFAHGFVVSGDDRPIVFVSLDWCELRNEAFARWREALAKAVETTVDRVLVSCVHQHDAPYVDLGAERMLRAAGAERTTCDPEFVLRTIERVAADAKAALSNSRPLTHLGRSRTRVERIASSRRVLKPDGTPYFGRYSSCREAKLREQPDGEIDPHLATLSFYDGDRALAAVRSYAVHPMSPYGRGVVSADFVGDARRRRQRDRPEAMQIYVTGCAGDVTAGKYNDGSPEVRGQLADRLYDAMVRADAEGERFPIDGVACRAQSIVLPHWQTPQLAPDALERTVADAKQTFFTRANAALGLSSRKRHDDGQHVDLQVVDFGAAQLALFPAESFVSFQLQVQQARPQAFVAAAAFGECAPGYLPTVAAVREGFREEHGYCWTDETAERRIVDGMKKLL